MEEIVDLFSPSSKVSFAIRIRILRNSEDTQSSEISVLSHADDGSLGLGRQNHTSDREKEIETEKETNKTESGDGGGGGG